MKRSIVLLLAAVGMTFPGAAGVSRASDHGTLSFILENDLFYNVDRHYTNGVGLSWMPGADTATPKWAVTAFRLLPWVPRQGEVRHGYAWGQSMFTPSDIRVKNPPPEERPYAGWLYGSIGLGVESGRQLDRFSLTIGIVGPASQAEKCQKIVHKIIGSDDPKGWDTQLENELGLVLAYQHSWREFAATTLIGNRLDVTPHVGAALGNVYTYGNAGLTLRYGPRLPSDYGPPRIQPGLLGSANFTPPADFGWYLFAGVEGRLVGRNIFLDGNTFRDSRSVDKEYLVGDLQCGLVLDWTKVRVSYTHVLRTREFRTQDGSDDFGAFSVSVKF